MTTLAELGTEEQRMDFAKKIASGSEKMAHQVIHINGSIKTSDELTQRIKDGKNIPFNFDRPIEELDDILLTE